MTHKLPPTRGSGTVTPLRPFTAHRLAAEQSVLGGLMLDNSAWPSVAAMLSEEDFFRAEHRLIFSAIAGLAARGDPFDVVTLSEVLQSRDHRVAAGGLPYLGALCRDTPSAANLLVYAEIVRKRLLQRQLQAALTAEDWEPQVARLHQQLATINTSIRGVADSDAVLHRCLAEIQGQSIDWLWRPYLPRRAITQICGDSDVGKSKCLYSIIATITTGGRFALTDEPVAQQRVVLLAAEEDAATMIKPALLAAGADCSRVELVESCAEWNSKGQMLKRAITLERDIAELARLVAQFGDVGLIGINPLTAYFGTRLDSNNNTQVRAVLMDLQRLAEEAELAVVGQNHYGKGHGNAKTKVLGSTAFVAGPRSPIGVFRDPDDPARKRCLWIPVKCNRVPEEERTGRAFHIVSKTVMDGTIELQAGVVEWFTDIVTETADSVMSRAAFPAVTQETVPQSPERLAVLAILREAAPVSWSARRIAERVEGMALPDFGDKRRVKVRRLLGKMLADDQVVQFPDKTYPLPSGEGG